MTLMNRKFNNGTEMRLFLWGLMNNEEWGSDYASYTEQNKVIRVSLPLGEGIEAKIRARSDTLIAVLTFTGDNIEYSETVTKIVGLRQVFRNEHKEDSEAKSCQPAIPGCSTGDLPDTGMVVSGDALKDAYDRYMAEPLQSNLGDLYNSYDHDTGGSFHGC